MQGLLRRATPVCVRRFRKAKRNAAFFDRFANRTDAPGSIIKTLMPDLLGKDFVARIHCAAGKDNCPTGKGHRCGSFYKQYVRRPLAPVAKSHKRRGRPRGRNVILVYCHHRADPIGKIAMWEAPWQVPHGNDGE